METVRLLIRPEVQVRCQLPEQPQIRIRITETPMYREQTKWKNSIDDFSFTVGQTVFLFADLGIPSGSTVELLQYDKQILTPEDFLQDGEKFTLQFPAEDVYINLAYL